MDIPEEVIEKIAAIFMPFAHERQKFVKENKIDFVHYTTAENALNIFRTRTVFMRNTVCMNDYSEFRHGLDLLREAFVPESPTRKEFFDSVNACGDKLGEEAVKLFDDWLPHNQFNVYVTCLSEHDPAEDQHGRLSMWRAYNRLGAVGVALVLDQSRFWQDSTSLQAFGSPVAYHASDKFNAEFQKVLKNVRENCDFLKLIPREKLVGTIFYMLIFAAACSKHPGFAEEREWRLVHLPKQTPSKILQRATESIDGIPQTVYKIPLVDRPNEGLNIEPAKLLKKVIIGPSNFPWPIYEAFVSELEAAGIPDAASRVVVSAIPLRTPN